MKRKKCKKYNREKKRGKKKTWKDDTTNKVKERSTGKLKIMTENGTGESKKRENRFIKRESQN